MFKMAGSLENHLERHYSMRHLKPHLSIKKESKTCLLDSTDELSNDRHKEMTFEKMSPKEIAHFGVVDFCLTMTSLNLISTDLHKIAAVCGKQVGSFFQSSISDILNV